MSGLTNILKSGDSGTLPKTIVFCQTKDIACKVYSTFRDAASQPRLVGLYHASMTDSTKLEMYKRFKESTVRILAATVAFGMVSYKVL